VFALAVLLLATGASLAEAQVGAGAFESIAPEGAVTGAEVERYPADRYSLDHFVDVGITDLDGIPALVAHTIAGLIWELTRFLVMAVISLVTWAFGFNLITGQGGGEGAIEPVAEAITAIRTEVVGDEWMVAAILVSGLWATGNALLRQRHSETLGGLATSVVLVTVAFAFVAEDQWVVRTVSAGVTDLAKSALGVAAAGDPGDGDQAREDVSNGLFETLVVRPYAVLEFGGVEHCTNADAEPVPCDDPTVERRIDHLPERFRFEGAGSTVTSQGAYLDHFLATEPGSDERQDQYEILKGEATPDDGERVVDVHDEPAVALMEEGGASERAGMATFVFVAELGAIVLVGLLALGVVVTQAIALLLLAFSPLFLLAALVPDAGHRLFLGWLRKLAWALVAEALLALALAVLLAVSAALSDATSSLGFLLAFSLQAAFFWLVLLNRNRLLAVAAGHDGRAIPRVPLRGAMHRTRAATYRAASVSAAALDQVRRRVRDGEHGRAHSSRPHGESRPARSDAPEDASSGRAATRAKDGYGSAAAQRADEPQGAGGPPSHFRTRRVAARTGESGPGERDAAQASAAARERAPSRPAVPDRGDGKAVEDRRPQSAERLESPEPIDGLADRAAGMRDQGGGAASRTASSTNVDPPTGDARPKPREIRVSTRDLRHGWADTSEDGGAEKRFRRVRRDRRDRKEP